MQITVRPYRDEEDYLRIRTLLQEIYAIGGPPIYCSIGDLDWWRFKYEDPGAAIATAHLWEKSDGTLVGVAWPEESEVSLFVHTHYRDLEYEMLVWSDEWRIEKVKTSYMDVK